MGWMAVKKGFCEIRNFVPNLCSCELNYKSSNQNLSMMWKSCNIFEDIII